MSLVGKPAADFRMASTKDMNSLSEDVTLADYAGRWLVLFFYPADFTFVCPSEVLAFSNAVPAFAEFDAEVLGVSTDGVYSHQAWCEFVLGKLNFPLASTRTTVSAAPSACCSRTRASPSVACSSSTPRASSATRSSTTTARAAASTRSCASSRRSRRRAASPPAGPRPPRPSRPEASGDAASTEDPARPRGRRRR